MKTCKIHPDREAVYKFRLCRECYRQRAKKNYALNKAIGANKTNSGQVTIEIKRERMDLNIKNLLADGSRHWSIKDLKRRYPSFSKGTICKLLIEHGIEIYKGWGYVSPKRHKNTVKTEREIFPDILESVGYIQPTHQYPRMSL